MAWYSVCCGVLLLLAAAAHCKDIPVKLQQRQAACVNEALKVLESSAADVDLQQQTELQEELTSFLSGIEISEGHAGNIPMQKRVYTALARLPCVQHVCEIGFNAGHSSSVWLAAKPELSLTSFDIAEHNYTYEAARFYAKKYPGRVTFTFGSSLDTVKAMPWFYRYRCNVIVVDGGHTQDIVAADIRNMRALAHARFSLFVVDDTPCDAPHCIGPSTAVEDLEKSGEVKVLKRFRTALDRGFLVGVYQPLTPAWQAALKDWGEN